MKFRTVPVEVDAIRFTGTNIDEITEFIGEVPPHRLGPIEGYVGSLNTLDGTPFAYPGDWIVRTDPEKPNLFKAWTNDDFIAGHVALDPPPREEPAARRGVCALCQARITWVEDPGFPHWASGEGLGRAATCRAAGAKAPEGQRHRPAEVDT